MKKNIFLMAAASAIMLTACTSDNDILQTAQQKQTAAKEVGFDVYTPAATNVTRAGQAGTMSTNRLQLSEAKGGGFGVYAYLVEDEDADAAAATRYIDWMSRTTPAKSPNFMINEKILWNATNQGWYYNPLKYWPNETNNDSQNTNAEMAAIAGDKHLDRLTFFAYAPYVSAGVDEPGITLLTNKKGVLNANPESDATGTVVEASVGYKASLDTPSDAVDLLWGVAPAGGLTYTAVNGQSVTVKEGEPLIDMTKPDVNTNMKFLFQHALARIGINVVAAIDQIGAGGKLDENTKITIDEVTLTGKFGETGVLNLDNPTANIAHWVDINGTAINSGTTGLSTSKTLTLTATAKTIAPDLRYEGPHTFGSYSIQTATGVTTTKRDLLTGRYTELDAVPTYSPAKQYYTDNDGTAAVATYTIQGTDAIYEYSSTPTEAYTKASGSINAPAYPNTTTSYYSIAEDGEFDGNHAKTYSQAECNTYNSTNVAGYIASGTVLDDTQASNVNTALSLTGDNVYSNGDVISETHANAYNATLTGARKTTDTTGDYGYSVDDLSEDTKLYTKLGDNYTYVGTASTIAWATDNTNKYYKITPTAIAASDINFTYSGSTFYEGERNYFMVVPTNNVKQLNPGLDADVEKALRTIRVKIKYYVTTEDDKVQGGRTQIENVIEKDVLFPSLANGKSYMLNLVLGLTSVKMEAEVDDWKVINVQADLPQNTAE